jgi:hypothetical protein
MEWERTPCNTTFVAPGVHYPSVVIEITRLGELIWTFYSQVPCFFQTSVSIFISLNQVNMGVEEKGQEQVLYQTDSGPREGQVVHVSNLRDFVEIPSFWNKIHALSEKLGAETIGVEQLPEEARDVNQKPHSKLSSKGPIR